MPAVSPKPANWSYIISGMRSLAIHERRITDAFFAQTGVWERFKLALVGLILEIAGAASLQKVVASEIYGVQVLDPFVLAGFMALFAIVALAACAVPARRALARRSNRCVEKRTTLAPLER